MPGSVKLSGFDGESNILPSLILPVEAGLSRAFNVHGNFRGLAVSKARFSVRQEEYEGKGAKITFQE